MEEVERRGGTFEATRPMKVSDDKPTPYDEATICVFEALTRAERITEVLFEKLGPLLEPERPDAQLREIQPDRLDVQILRPLHEYADRLTALAERIAFVKDRLVV